VRLLDDYEDVLSHMRAADEVIADADLCVEPTVNALAERFDAALGGARPPTSPTEHGEEYDWDAIATQAETAYRRAIDAQRSPGCAYPAADRVAVRTA
jgi:hypothetical protein